MASSVAAPTRIGTGRAKPRYTRAAALGFLLIASGMFVWFAGGLMAGQSLGGDTTALAGIGLVAVLAAGAVWRFGTRGMVGGAVFALVLLGALHFAVFSLAVPKAFVEFSGAVMFVVGALAALGFSIAGIVRRAAPAGEASAGEARAMRAMLGVVALAMLVSAVLSFTGRTSVAAAEAAGASRVSFEDFEFAATDGPITVAAGESAKLVIRNGDAFVHNVAIPALGVEPVLVSPGSEKLVEFSAEPGSYTMYCTLHSDTSETDPQEAGMAATLIAE